jgi:glutathione reductase (NADPH)
MSKTYDAVIVGSGTAGQTVAHDLARNRMKVALVERSRRPGGTCALYGCQAKKWFFEGAETVARSRHLAGVGIETPATADWRQLRDAKNRFTAGVPERTVDGLKQAGVDFIQGNARFVDEGTLAVDQQRISASHIVLATGAVPMPLPIDGAQFMISSKNFMELAQLPRRIVFIGGGFISFEFAHFAVRLGPNKVSCTILEAGRRPLGPFDDEMVELLAKASADEGIDIHCDVEIVSIKAFGNVFRVNLKDGRHFEADLVVHGAGRIPDLSELDLEKANIHYGKRGITVDRKMATTNSRVYAVGDCAATIQLARVADYEAKIAVADILQQADNRLPEILADYTVVPSLLFTYPQYGMLGATEQALKEQGATYKKSFAKDLTWPTYRRVGMKTAAYKILVGNDGMLLGAHVLSDNAAGMIAFLTLAMANRISAKDLYRQCLLTPYPSRESDLLYMLGSLAE